MKRKMNFAQLSRTVLWLGLIFCVGLTAARAQVIPRVCYEAKLETITRMMAANEPAGQNFFRLNQAAPQGYYRIVINPGGATEESFAFSRVADTSIRTSDTGLLNRSFTNAHAAGETILLTTDGEAVFGYNNTSADVVTIPRGVSSHNYFAPGVLAYLGEPRDFQPGVHENVVRMRVLSDLRSSGGNNLVPTWYLDGSQASWTTNGQGCATITYQGRLSDAGNSANGQFDLQFQAFDLDTGGAAQSELITLENVQVTSGVFTVPLFFGSTFSNNIKPRFLEIGVRAGTSTGVFTVLTPRQPLTQVPYAVNAQTAQTAFDVRLQLTVNAPPSAECNETKEYGQMKFDAVNNRLYICAATGWKAFVPQ